MNLGTLVRDVDDMTTVNRMPAGQHIVAIESIEGMTTKSGGKALKLILKPQDYGITVYDYINIKNDSPDAENIGKKVLKKLAVLCGADINNLETDHLLGKQVKATFALDDKGYPKVKSYDEAVTSDFPVFTDTFVMDDVPF